MEYSPFGQSEDISEFCNDNGMVIICDEPLLHNMRHTHPVLISISDELGITVDEV